MQFIIIINIILAYKKHTEKNDFVNQLNNDAMIYKIWGNSWCQQKRRLSAREEIQDRMKKGARYKKNVNVYTYNVRILWNIKYSSLYQIKTITTMHQTKCAHGIKYYNNCRKKICTLNCSLCLIFYSCFILLGW